MKKLNWVLATGVLIACSSAPLAQDAAQEAKNQQLALNWYREVVAYGHVDLANKYMSDDFAEHSANVSGGRADFVAYYGKMGAKPLQPQLPRQPIQTLTKGDYVVLVWEIEDEDAKGVKYKYNNFDVIRIANGKIAEHWDSLLKN